MGGTKFCWNWLKWKKKLRKEMEAFGKQQNCDCWWLFCSWLFFMWLSPPQQHCDTTTSTILNLCAHSRCAFSGAIKVSNSLTALPAVSKILWSGSKRRTAAHNDKTNMSPLCRFNAAGVVTKSVRTSCSSLHHWTT